MAALTVSRKLSARVNPSAELVSRAIPVQHGQFPAESAAVASATTKTQAGRSSFFSALLRALSSWSV
jgi:hypothetical protein